MIHNRWNNFLYIGKSIGKPDPLILWSSKKHLFWTVYGNVHFVDEDIHIDKCYSHITQNTQHILCSYIPKFDIMTFTA